VGHENEQVCAGRLSAATPHTLASSARCAPRQPNMLWAAVRSFRPAPRLTATMCLATASCPSSAVSQVRTVRALSIVSVVVKVLEMTMTRVVSAGGGQGGRAGQ
jgi:hypothetical protein